MPVNTVEENAAIMLRHNKESILSRFMHQDAINAAKEYIAKKQTEQQPATMMTPTHPVTGNNIINSTSTLWSVVTEPVAEKYSSLLAPLETMGQNILDRMPATYGGKLPVINMPVIDGAGNATKNPSNIQTSSLTSHSVPMELNVYALSAGLSYTDMANGAKIDPYLPALYKGMANTLFGEVTDSIKAKAPVLTGNDIAPDATHIGIIKVNSEADITPTFIAKKIRSCFHGKGKVESLVLNVDAYSNTIPTDALALTDRPGRYGIDAITESTAIESVDGADTAVGIVLREQGVSFLATEFDLFDSPSIQIIDAGKLGPVPLKLIVSANDAELKLYYTLIAVFGVAVSDTESVAVISTGAAPEGEQPAA